MQPHPYQGLELADIPLGVFPDDTSTDLVLTPPGSTLAPFADGAPAKAATPAPSRAVRLVRAKSGETEMRLLAVQEDDGISYVLVKAQLAPYSEKREALLNPDENKTPMNYQQALDEFKRRVALAYPPEKLRHGPSVEIHINLI